MLLPKSATIDLATFESACLSFVSLSGLEIEPGQTVLDPRFKAEVEEAVERFGRWITDRPETEQPVRYALAWLLNLDRSRFDEVVSAMDVSFPVYGELGTLRRFFELLWEGNFASWEVWDFDPDANRAEGLRTG